MQNNQGGVGGAPGQSMSPGGMEGGPGGAAVSQMGAQIAAPGQGSKSLLDKGSQPGAPGQSMRNDAEAGGAPGQSAGSASGGPSQPRQSLMEASASGGPGQAPGNAEEGGASGGPGGKQADAAQSGAHAGPGGKTKADPELKPGEARAGKEGASAGPAADAAPGVAGGPGSSGGPGASAGPGASGGPSASGGPGAAEDEDDLVDPDADRPDFGRAAADDDAATDDDEEDADGQNPVFAGMAARAGGKGRKAAKKSERKPIDPAYVTVAVMGLAVVSLAAMIWLGRGALMEMWPDISGFYKTVGVEAARPGDGLRISESSKRLLRIGGVETLVVRGFISNISEVPKAVPNLRLELYNEKKEVVQDSAANAPVGLLDPSGSVEFEIRMELPQLNAAKGGYAVVWAE